ncbi:MAG: hypothetical protein AAF432_02290 [Planctomycetota bacterium]
MIDAPEQPDAGQVLFTAFEPSGDAHAAPVIRTLRERHPALRIAALGGPKMANAGAEIIQLTTHDAAMGLGALGKIKAIRAARSALRAWCQDRAVDIHVPTDAPAANWSFCADMKKRGATVMHLVCPQIWAWAGWRIRRLHRWSDHVMCLLSFEEAWLRERGVDATFIGHPRLNRALHDAALAATAASFPDGSPRVVLLPGSRRQEVVANLPVMLETVKALRDDAPELTAIICVGNDDIREHVDDVAPQRPEFVHTVVGETDAGIHWADAALAVSGTVTLDVARQRTPMVGLYRITRFSRAVSRLLLTPGYRLLPNLIAGDEVVPEFVPYAGNSEPVINAARRVILDATVRQDISAQLEAVCATYDGKEPDEIAASLIMNMMQSRGSRSSAVAQPA